MAQPSYPPSPNPISVIGSQFIAPCPFEVIIVRKSNGDHVITDVNHKILFKVKRRSTSYHDQRLIVDANEIPIILIREKILTAHKGWKAFKGNSNADSDKLFITRTPKIMHSKSSVHVFLANKSSSKDSCDFKITGSWSNRSCTIYMGESSTILAQMHKVEPLENVKDKFMVKIYPYVDYAFVVSLMVIVEAMKSSYAENYDAENHVADNDDADQVTGDAVESIGEVAESVGVVAEVIGTMFS